MGIFWVQVPGVDKHVQGRRKRSGYTEHTKVFGHMTCSGTDICSGYTTVFLAGARNFSGRTHEHALSTRGYSQMPTTTKKRLSKSMVAVVAVVAVVAGPYTFSHPIHPRLSVYVVTCQPFLEARSCLTKGVFKLCSTKNYNVCFETVF